MSYAQERYSRLIDKIEQAFLPQLTFASPLSSQDEINVTSNNQLLTFIKKNLLAPLPLIVDESASISTLKDINKSKRKINGGNYKLPKMSEIKVRLFDVWESTQINILDAADSRTKIIQWYFLAQMSAAVQCLFVDKILFDSINVTETINGWNRYQESNLNGTLLYMIESFPGRTMVGFYTHFGLLYNRKIDINYYYNKGEKIVKDPYNLLVKKPWKNIKKEIKYNKDKLKRYHLLNASSLGLIGELPDIFSECENDLDKMVLYIFKSIKSLSQMLELLQMDHNNFPNADALVKIGENVNAPSNIEEVYTHLTLVISLLETHKDVANRINNEFGPPSLWSQLLLPSLVSYFTFQRVSSILWQHKDDLIHYAFEFKDTIMDFTKNWIVQPMLSMYDTIRYKNHKLAVASEASLKSDIQSLERMVQDFAISNKIIDQTELATLSQRIHDGDISLVLKAYEADLKHPLNGLLFGNLIQTMLIQVQKLKVDASLALNALDSLLKSNEFTFGLIAVIPPILFSYYTLKFIRNWYLNRIGQSKKHITHGIKTTLNRIFRLLNEQIDQQDMQDSERYLNQGYLLCHVQYLRKLITELNCFNSQEDQDNFLLCLRDLETFTMSPNQRLNALNHIYLAYPKLMV